MHDDNDDNFGPTELSSEEKMHRVADTVGFMPNVRWKDNLIQGAIVLVLSGIGMFVGYQQEGGLYGLLLGLLAGLVGGTFLSGLGLGIYRLLKRPGDAS